MLKVLESKRSNVVLTVATSSVTTEDYKNLVKQLNKSAQKTGKVRWYFEIKTQEQGESPLKNLLDDIQDPGSFEKIAIVGNIEIHDWIISFIKQLKSGEMRYFNPREQDEAQEWINE